MHGRISSFRPQVEVQKQQQQADTETSRQQSMPHYIYRYGLSYLLRTDISCIDTTQSVHGVSNSWHVSAIRDERNFYLPQVERKTSELTNNNVVLK